MNDIYTLEKISFERIPTNGIQLHCAQAGPPNAPLVLLLHGFPEFWYGWRHQILRLADCGWRVVAPDQRGYNRSDKPKGVNSYNMQELTADIAGLLDTLGRTHCILVGHDWGAAVAWATAIRYPERISRMAILNVPHPDVMARTLLRHPEQLFKSWYIFIFQFPWLPERLLLGRNCALLRQMMKTSAQPGTFNEADLDKYVAAWRQPGALTSMLGWYRAAFRTAVQQLASLRRIELRPIHVPTLMLWGENDIALSKKMAQPSIELCDQGKLVLFPDATHWVQHDEAEAVNQHLLDFFNIQKYQGENDG